LDTAIHVRKHVAAEETWTGSNGVQVQDFKTILINFELPVPK